MLIKILLNASITVTAKGKKKRGRKPKNSAAAVASGEDEAEDADNKKGGVKGSPMAKESSTAPTSAATAWRQPPSSSSFQQYRRAGDMGEVSISVCTIVWPKMPALTHLRL